MKKLLGLVSLFLIIGCMAMPAAKPSDQCAQIREIFSKEVSAGMEEAAFMKFCESHGWKPRYNKFDNRYVERIPVSKEDNGLRHAIMIDVWLTAERRVKSYTVEDSYTGP